MGRGEAGVGEVGVYHLTQSFEISDFSSGFPGVGTEKCTTFRCPSEKGPTKAR